ncbi:hypothetical protein REG_1888 [Candidatus Regiella insecticola LSR1]|uniref:Uncharacterized protein n=1 Tax=Candidatus Regiella insecticola LSR1 TaxID=663321 RepID=E0WUY2_9ENTR|nr:hypothetical protein [Candidatus Regiella insecticola]EFL91184.1 hypothetical protein REG_1888 [Candidatus Regiella insecticola LSR1]
MNLLKLIIIGLYGVIGLVGWYKYTELVAHPVTVVTVDKFSSEMTVAYIRAMVWYHSRGKLQELRSILLTDNLANKKQIKIRITNMLKHRTSAYIRDFNSLDTPIENIGNWYQNNFDFDNFLSAVFDEVFNNKLSVEEKIRSVSDVMEAYQNLTTQKLLINLNKLKGN